MSTQFISPLRGEPPTTEQRDEDGNPCFVIKPCVLTPLRAKAVDMFRAILGVASFFLFILVVVGNLDTRHGTWGSVLWFGICLYGVQHFLGWLAAALIRRTTTITLTTATVSVNGLLGTRAYDRNLEHRFACIIHDEAQAEAVRNDFKTRKAAQKGEVIAPPVYYGNSAHVVMELAGHRVDLLEVFDQNIAGSIVARLQYCDRLLDAAVRKGGGWGETPEWDRNAPGGL